ncbi:D-amino acid dehydrogenase [Pusillimonas sp. CC-YST705]|uniref:D-amino acid dehydrogenase n=1 Tax=Mesopusillimonas faecipullorum TaxID=2755040 RepID=A0ABS8CCD7_9BURK|nr:D-amino acid dehydrogenase [Mesopusillimonas faecipullorum]MCB5363264.1 D-amino acid dehydrogenase [Mesopusillimonas faecipullorum]
MKVAVLGSGIIGTSTAWWLSQAGHEVVVLERHGGPALETSRANGGQISVSYSEPWANPHTLLKVLKWLLRNDAPMAFRPRLDVRQWMWCAAFLRECLPQRLPANIQAMVAMSEYSLETLKAMRAELDIEYAHQARGILNFYRSAGDFEASQEAAGLMRDYGLDRRIVNVDEMLEIEPALAQAQDALVGGDYTQGDESGDVYLFTTALAAKAQQAGVQFRFNCDITRLDSQAGQVQAVELIGPDGRFERLTADAYVVAMGSWTPHLVQPLGVACPVYPAKGYSATFKVLDTEGAPFVSLTDSANKVVYSRLGERLRMAGMAEIGGYSRGLNAARCNQMTRLARELFPNVLDFDNVDYWSGLRPTTPSNVPLIGRTRVGKLYLNTGHGTLGWTMGVGSGKALADIISGKRPEPDFPFLG